MTQKWSGKTPLIKHIVRLSLTKGLNLRSKVNLVPGVGLEPTWY